MSEQPEATPTSSASTAAPSHDPSTLPPEALDLAAKLFDFAREGKTSDLEAYISQGIPPNLTDSRGNTFLMLAAYHDHADTASMLIAKGSDPNATNDRGQSPLAGAVFKGYEGVVKVLVQEGKADVYGGQPNAVDCARMFKRDGLLEIMGVSANGNGGDA
jgi:ankyrin repeat protein